MDQPLFISNLLGDRVLAPQHAVVIDSGCAMSPWSIGCGNRCCCCLFNEIILELPLPVFISVKFKTTMPYGWSGFTKSALCTGQMELEDEPHEKVM